MLATDIAPGMIKCVAERLTSYLDCRARVMNGEALDFADGAFDVSFSISGVSGFADWRKGLSEVARVVRKGGHGCLASWHNPPGGGPFLLLAEAKVC